MFTSTTDHPIFECPSRAMLIERRWKSNPEIAPNCPRCASSNTKFCYYNNYSLSQPRYFCKGCRRYWTKGGSLRNVPIGGGCRKSRRSKSARQLERLNYHMPSPGSTGNESDNNSNGDGVNIDLAAVFAKFLNQEDSNDQESLSGASSTSPDLPPSNSLEMENFMVESQLQLQPSDHLIDFGNNFNDVDQGLHQLCLEDEIIDPNALDQFQAILEDDINGWSTEDIGTSLPNFDVQNVLQFQDFGAFSNIEDQTKFPSNIAYDNWSSFDPSGY